MLHCIRMRTNLKPQALRATAFFSMIVRRFFCSFVFSLTREDWRKVYPTFLNVSKSNETKIRKCCNNLDYSEMTAWKSNGLTGWHNGISMFYYLSHIKGTSWRTHFTSLSISLQLCHSIELFDNFITI